MIKKSYYIENPASLSLALDQIVIQQDPDKKVTRPLDDAGMIVIDNPQVTITAPLLQACAAQQVSIVVCDQKHLPCVIWLPLSGHILTGGRTRAQLESSKPLNKQLWQTTIKSKIINQSKVLTKRHEPTATLDKLALSVRSADSTNTEATAAAYYWKYWLGPGSEFRRDPEGEPPNHLLNYGYSILRSMAARLLIGSGLWPINGMHHCNVYNVFPLADDIMEPFRPFVDHLVLEMIDADPIILENYSLEKKDRTSLLRLPFIDVQMGGVTRPLQVAMQLSCASLAKCYEEKSAEFLEYPTIN